MANTPDAAPASDAVEVDRARLVPARRLRVLVGSLPIEDGQLRPPAVGEVSRLTLTFLDTDGEEGDPSVSTVRAHAEPLADGFPRGPGREWDGTEREGPVSWLTVLHGDGWSATWSAPRPVVGQVQLTGRLVDNLDIGVRTRARGRVTRVRVVTETCEAVDTGDPDQADWRRVPAEERLRDVEVAPRWFDHGLIAPPEALADAPAGGVTFFSPVPADPWVSETGVLVDLDLDDVPPLPTRPRVVPGALAAHGPDLWILDERLPLLLRVRRPLTEHAEVTEFAWAGRILSELEGQAWLRALHADVGGCWITGPDGAHRADGDSGSVELVDPDQTSALIRDGVLTQVVSEPGIVNGQDWSARLRRRRYPGPTSEDIDLGEGHVEGLVATEEGGFLALRRHLPYGVPVVAHRQPAWLTAVGPDGEVTHGPHLEIAGSLYSSLLASDPPIVDDSRAHARHGALRRVRADLTVDDGVPSERMLLGTYSCAGRLWVLAHPPHPDTLARGGPAACWPLIAPPVYLEDRQHWLLTELHPTTLEPLISHLVPRHPRHLSVDQDGTVWVLADGLRHLPLHDGATATLLNLEHLTKHPQDRDQQT